MSQINRSKKFVKTIFVLLILSIISYIYIYDKTVKDRSWGVHSYKNFLLENTKKSPRIIFDSGSSLHHSINSKMFEEEFHRVTINLGDNGAYPLKYKLLRIQKQSIPNDIVILPLEYLHYSYHNIPKVFYDNIFGSLSFYYLDMDILDKIEFISQTPFSSLLYTLFDEKRYIDYTYYFMDIFNSGERGDLNFIKKGKLDKGSKSVSCEVYILTQPIEYQFVISDTFKENIKLMKKIEKKSNIKFVVTYPAVAGDECYSGKYAKEFKSFVEKIKIFLKDSGIPMVGRVEDSNFTKEYMNDTYYHILPKARDIRTKRLIASIKRSKVYEIFTNSHNDDYKLDYKESLKYKKLQPIVFGEAIHFKYNHHNDNLLAVSGWYPRESWGMWSKGDKSKLVFKIDRDKIDQDIFMTLKVRIFQKKTKTKILINSKLLGEYLLYGRHKIEIKKSFLREGINTIELQHKDVVSPKNDGRKLKLGLEFVKFDLLN